MENRIKEQRLGLFADRTSSSQMQANQLRLYFSAFAYLYGAHNAPSGSSGDEVGTGAEADSAGNTAEDRGKGSGHHAQGLVVLFR